MGETTTVIEDILESIGTVPNAVKRNVELIRELDGRVEDELKAATDIEDKVLASSTTKRRQENHRSVASLLGEEGRADVEGAAKKRRLCDDLSDEKVAVAEQILAMLSRHVEVVSEELQALSTHLHATGEFESSGAAKPGDEVAIRLEGDEWVLGRVTKFRPEVSAYDVADADDSRKIYTLNEAHVVPLSDLRGSVAAPHALAPVASVLCSLVDAKGNLVSSGSAAPTGEQASGGPHHVLKLSKGDDVFAIYPDTTSFYPAVVSVPPRRTHGLASNAICHVQFNDDADDSGLNPDRPVALKYILRPVV